MRKWSLRQYKPLSQCMWLGKLAQASVFCINPGVFETACRNGTENVQNYYIETFYSALAQLYSSKVLN